MPTEAALEALAPVVDQQRKDFASYCAGADAGEAISVGHAELWHIIDQYGDKYLDFADGGLFMPVGYNNPGVQDALRGQLMHYVFTGPFSDQMHRHVVDYAKAISQRFPLDSGGNPLQVLFLSSQSEAVAVAGELCEVNPDLNWVDEYYTGFGRVGRWPTQPHADLTILGPGAGGGLSLGVLVGPARLLADLGQPMHAYPVACAAGLATLNLVEGGLLEHVIDTGHALEGYIKELSDQFPQMTGCYGEGLDLKIALTDFRDGERFWRDCRERGLLLHRDLRMTPPLIINEVVAKIAVDIMAAVLMEW